MSNILRTPPKHGNGYPEIIEYPSGKLAALTRKSNEIKCLISQNNRSESDRIRVLYREYLDKQSAFFKICDHQIVSHESKVAFKVWLEKNKCDFVAFREEVTKWFLEGEESSLSPEDSVSNVEAGEFASRVSNRSVRSVSSLRVRLAEERAKRIAEQKYAEERLKLEEQEFILKQKRSALEIQKALDIEKNLELEIRNIEDGTEISRRTAKLESSKEHYQLPGAVTRDVPIETALGFTEPKFHELMRKQNEISLMLACSQDRALLPRNEPDIFDGHDLTQYKLFMTAFKRMIEIRCHNDSDKLYYLEKYTAGGPRELVRSCIGGDDSFGFKRAIELLNSRYGNDFKIAESYLTKIERWTPLKNEDSKGLEELSVFLTSCANCMRDVTALNQLNSPKEIMCIVRRLLPYKLRERWRTYSHSLVESGEMVTFKNLVKFVEREASVLNLPVFGNIRDFSNEAVNRPTTQHKKRAFVSFAENVKDLGKYEARQQQQTIECLCCKKTNHWLGDCIFFGKKSNEEKLEFVKENGLCFACLCKGHNSKGCFQRLTCTKCKGKHPMCLHRGKQDEENPKNGERQNYYKRPDEPKRSCSTKSFHPNVHTRAGINKKIVCSVLPVKIKIEGHDRCIETYMALDSFSTDCFMSEGILQKLGIRGIKRNLQLTTMSDALSEMTTQVVNNLQISDLDENEGCIIPVVYAQNNWPFSMADSPSPDDIASFPQLQDIPFQYIPQEIGILVGMNAPEIMKPLKIVDTYEGGPFATLYKFGWAFSGPVTRNTNRGTFCHRVAVNDRNDIENKLEEMYAREFRDLNEDELGPSIEDLEWERQVSSSLRKRDDGHYEVNLPLKRNDVTFPSNREQVRKRLYSVKRHLERNNEFRSDYEEFMNMMLESGFAEKIPDDEIQVTPGKIWYLAHHGVYHKRKKKIRVVFDCSLKYCGVSLNSELLSGPDLTNNLLGVLLRFRQEKIAFTGDIEKMFYQVKVPKHQCDFLRFLWFTDCNLENEPEEYRLLVHVFGAVSSPSCSNYVLKHTALEECNNYCVQARNTVLRNFYVDDLVKSEATLASAKSVQLEVCNMLAMGGFNLTGFASNSREFLSTLDSITLAKELKDVDLLKEDLPYERALGVTWNIQNDSLGFNVHIAEFPFTRRGVLSTMFSIYDPFGIVGPVILPAKRIFQLACKAALDWDISLPNELLNLWKDWLHDLPLLQNYEIPRCYKSPIDSSKIQLHIFCDGSESAYAAVAYLRFVNDDGSVHCSIIMAKNRLTPLSGNTMKTIPRIELNADRLAVILSRMIRKELELEIEDEWFWTDSTTVLKYINNESKRFQRFVTNRVSYIRRYTDPIQWRYVPTKLNPADLGSRGASVTHFFEANYWKFGPQFLWYDERFWPKNDYDETVSDDDPEIKHSKTFLVKTSEDTTTKMLLESCSDWQKTKRRIAYILRVKSGLREKKWLSSPLSVGELEISEREIWKFVQKESFPLTIELLQAGKTLPKNDHLIQLNPFIDEFGLLRVGGRIGRATVSYNVKHPVILPNNSHAVHIFMRDIHRKVGHLSKASMLSTLRQNYWVIKGNVLAKKVVRDCIACRRRDGRPSTQIMADLPIERVEGDQRAFTNVGIDCFGPFLVSHGRGRSKEKRYGIIFTCLASRAVHVEVIYSLDTDSFLSALSRFMSRRGQIKTILSDNGTNFVAGNRELQESIASWNKSSESWMTQRGIIWKFNPPGASHFGGVWEREIRTIRKVLDALINEQVIRMSDERLNTLMCEVENILNNRPITEISSDPNDLEPLTPNHLLLSDSGITFPPGLFTVEDLYAKRRWRQVQYLADLFWLRWKREYLPLLQKRQKWVTNREPHKEGDLVLVIDQNLPRNQWCTGRILQVLKDKKGCVRIAKILIAKARNFDKLRLKIDRVVIERPVTKLVLLRPVDNL